ncbi:Uncharacterized protein conserved in bacteria [Serratia quinivorans]|uniref:winged helix-turn-helix domain-containing protein n=1 Tax=Serratia quinivorans TaxID=137545 RepID=UPI00217BF29F|nr:winged helix-turn-helix domain-containing protein [Serratia quinivorans]CAI1821525.1 Uncharacterized protein conserved in bacteria [Serratia quinivorans]
MAKQKITDEQLKAELSAGLTSSQIARKYSVHVRRVQERKAAFAKKGFSPEHDMVHMVPDGFKVRGVSTLYGKDGKKSTQWVKSSIDAERQFELMQIAAKALAEDLPKMKPAIAPEIADQHLLNTYIISDYHLGMLADEDESGDDWDIKIAERLLMKWFNAAIALAPNSSEAVLCLLGDTLHFDGMEAKTPTSGHILDADSRFHKVVDVAIRIINIVCQMLLKKHQKLKLIIATGNHDIASSVWLRAMFAALYSNEPRMEVDKSPDNYQCVEFGKTSLFFHHAHRANFDRMEQVFVAKFREVFGRTKFSYAHCGHLHHAKLKESNMMITEQHRTLAAKDAYSSQGGYMSGRSASVITYSSEYGEVSRLTISPDMLK